MDLRKALMEFGCTEMFAKRALIYGALFDGDIEKFVQLAESYLAESYNDPNIIRSRKGNAAASTLDEGRIQADIDYDGISAPP